jgi:hypothetical protein
MYKYFVIAVKTVPSLFPGETDRVMNLKAQRNAGGGVSHSCRATGGVLEELTHLLTRASEVARQAETGTVSDSRFQDHSRHRPERPFNGASAFTSGSFGIAAWGTRAGIDRQRSREPGGQGRTRPVVPGPPSQAKGTKACSICMYDVPLLKELSRVGAQTVQWTADPCVSLLPISIHVRATSPIEANEGEPHAMDAHDLPFVHLDHAFHQAHGLAGEGLDPDLLGPMVDPLNEDLGEPG